MIISRRNIPIPNSQDELKGQPVAYIAKAKFLSVIVDKRINCKGYVSFVARNVFKLCGILYNILNCLTTHANSLSYYSLVNPF